MKCANCGVSHFDNWDEKSLYYGRSSIDSWSYRSSRCPECKEYSIELIRKQFSPALGWSRVSSRLVQPPSSSRGPVSKSVPKEIAADYLEACSVLPISPKASAALSRRCLQAILNMQGYKAPNLANQIDAVLGESDASKSLPSALQGTIDAIRNFGNFSAHPIDDKTTLQIIDVDPEEAEWCLQILEEMFDHYFVKPAEAARKKAELDAKLKAAQKPQSK